MTSRLGVCPLIIVTFFLAQLVFPQIPLTYYLPSTVQYDPQIPTPQSFFRFQVGEWHLNPDQIHSYMRALDAASDRVSVEEFGRTYEDRPMLLVTITSPENHRNIATIKQQRRQLSDPSKSAGLNLESMPVVVWMGYSVHGNEPSGSNASVLVAYHLAAAQGAEIEKQLRETVVLLNPSINPDGLNRFATWANMHKGKVPVANPASREHNEVWPGGRTNHYWFDLNRDWMPLQHPESRGRLAKYYEWMPNLLTDHHEMGTNNTFFFQPGVPARNNPLVPGKVIELTNGIARYHAEALDRIGSLYYSEEGFDDFYIGKGSSYPDITGAVGILFEQGSSRGHLQESIHGDISFPFTIRNQFTTSLSTLTAAQAMRKELLSHQREFFSSAVREAERSTVKAYLFGSPDARRNEHLVEILRGHQIQVFELARSSRLEGKTFEVGKAFVVPTHQPQYRLVTSLFERRTSFEDSLFYDVSTWTLPLAFNLSLIELKSLDHSLLGKEVTQPVFSSGTVSGGRSSYAYVFEWHPYYAPRALYRLLKAGVRAKVATRPFENLTADGRKTFDYGTILVPVGIQPEKADTIFRLLDYASREDAVHVYALRSGLSQSGIDLGSPSFQPLELPTIALLVGPGVSFTDAGEVWHLLDRRFEIETTLLDLQILSRTNLSRYSVIIMAGGNYGGIDSSGRESLKRWIDNGGVVVATENAVEWLINTKIVSAQLRKVEPPKKDTVVQQRPYADEEAARRALDIPGTIFEVRYDRTHPLLFGYQDSQMTIFRGTQIFLEPSTSPYATPVIYTDKPLVSGYFNKRHEKELKGSAAVVVQPSGNGRTILIADNPNFRAFWYGTSKLFLNALFLGSAIRPSSTRTD